MKYPSIFLCAFALLPASNARAVTLMQIDTFDVSILGWAGGGGASNTHVPGGGPGGAADAYYSLGATGFHLGTKNTTQWLGNYAVAGITSIEMDLNAFSFLDNGGVNGPGPGAPLIYVLLDGPGGAWTSANPVSLPVGGGWQHVSFGLMPGELVYLSGGTHDVDATLAGVTKLLIRHDYVTPTPPAGHPNHVTATLGLDNIRAVPEPSGIGLLAAGALSACFRRGRRSIGGPDS